MKRMRFRIFVICLISFTSTTKLIVKLLLLRAMKCASFQGCFSIQLKQPNQFRMHRQLNYKNTSQPTLKRLKETRKLVSNNKNRLRSCCCNQKSYNKIIKHCKGIQTKHQKDFNSLTLLNSLKPLNLESTQYFPRNHFRCKLIIQVLKYHIYLKLHQMNC